MKGFKPEKTEMTRVPKILLDNYRALSKSSGRSLKFLVSAALEEYLKSDKGWPEVEEATR